MNNRVGKVMNSVAMLNRVRTVLRESLSIKLDNAMLLLLIQNRGDKMSQGLLGEQLGFAPDKTCKIVNNLSSSGLVIKLEDTDSCVIYTTTTTEGDEMCNKIRKEIRKLRI